MWYWHLDCSLCSPVPISKKAWKSIKTVSPVERYALKYIHYISQLACNKIDNFSYVGTIEVEKCLSKKTLKSIIAAWHAAICTKNRCLAIYISLQLNLFYKKSLVLVALCTIIIQLFNPIVLRRKKNAICLAIYTKVNIC